MYCFIIIVHRLSDDNNHRHRNAPGIRGETKYSRMLFGSQYTHTSHQQQQKYRFFLFVIAYNNNNIHIIILNNINIKRIIIYT